MSTTPTELLETTAAAVEVMTYAEYEAAAMESEVIIEAYVQATQSWWANSILIVSPAPFRTVPSELVATIK